MASIKIYKSVNGYEPYGYLTVSQGSQSIVGNYTVVNWSLVLYRPSKVYASMTTGWSVNIGGNGYSGSYTIGGSGTKTLSSGSTVIYHNGDGTQSISFSGSVAMNITWNGTYIGTVSNSSSMGLSTIPRVTTPTLSNSNITLGESVTINTPRKSSSFTHTLSYAIGDKSGTIASGVSTSYDWTPPKDFCEEITTSTSGTVKITCTTYNGSSSIGSNVINLTVNVPSDVVPTLSISVEDSGGYLDKCGYYLVGLSKYKVTFTENTQYGATITQRETLMNGKSFDSINPISQPLSSMSMDSIKSTITDSRGRTAVSEIKDLPLREYVKPKIISFAEPIRCTQGGALDDNGDYIKTKLVFEYDDIGGTNTASATLKLRERTKTTYGYSFTLQNNTEILVPANHNHTWFLLYEVKDTIGTITTYQYRLSTNDSVFSAKDGCKVAVGQSAELGTKEKPIFESAWHTVVKGLEVSEVDHTITPTEYDELVKILGGGS